MISDLLRDESEAQGHTLTGAMGKSFSAVPVTKGRERILEGRALKYTDYVNDGFPAKSASFKQAPFLEEYFIKRGFPVFSSGGGITAKQMAFATISKWMKEGMSTQASKRFSKTGARQNMIEAAFTGGDTKIDQFMSSAFDKSIDDHYHITKSETV